MYSPRSDQFCSGMSGSSPEARGALLCIVEE